MTDFKTLKLKWTPNQFLVSLPGFGPAKPHRESPTYAASADDVHVAIKAIALDQPSVTLLAEDPKRRKLEFVQRTRILRFPDFVSVEVVPVAGERSALLVYSRSRYGIRDFGANRRRVERWLGLLGARLGASGR